MGEALAMTRSDDHCGGGDGGRAAPMPTGHWMHNLDPVALDLGFFQMRWYSLAYLAGIVIGYLYLLRLIKQPGAPMARRHADDFVFYVTLGIILGGRLGYVLFYKPMDYIREPLEILQLWDGGMSFHGGLIGSTLAVLYLARKNGLSFLRVARLCGLLRAVRPVLRPRRQFRERRIVGPADRRALGDRASRSRLRQPDVWGPAAPPEPALRGRRWRASCCSWSCWRSSGSRARATSPACSPACSSSATASAASSSNSSGCRTTHLTGLAAQTGLSMGQWLTMPMLLLGLYLIITSRKRDPIVRRRTAT